MRGLRIVMNRICNIKRLPIDPGPPMLKKEPISTYQDASRRCCTQNIRVRGTCDASSFTHTIISEGKRKRDLE